MKSLARFMPLALVIGLLSMLFGCGGGTAVPVNPPHAQVAVAIAEDSISLGAGESYHLTATVTGNSNTAVTWSLSGCTGAACGTLSATGIYTAPSTISTEAMVTVAATSQADPTKFDSVAVHHMPIEVSIAPAGAWVTPGRTVDFTAAVRYDANNVGVAWALGPACSATCGTLSNVARNSVTYTAPATVPDPPTVTLTATSITDPSKSAEVITTVSGSGGLTEGDYAFFFNGWEILSTQPGFYVPSRVATAGHFHADAKGNITNGVEDINSSSGVSQSLPFTGTYSIGSDRRGSFTITTAQGTATYHMTVEASGSRGKFIKFDALPIDAPISGAGYFELQDMTAFSLSALSGPYALGVFGTVNANRLAAVGRFNAGPSGTFSSGKMDVTVQTHIGVDPQVTSTNLTLAGSFSAPSSSTGRGTAALTLSPAPGGVAGNLNFAYYVISDEKVLLVETDTRSSTIPVLSSEVRRQNGPFSAASFNAPTVFSMAGVNRANYGAEIVNAAVGQMVPDGSGSMTGIIDDNQRQGATNKAFTGSYTVASDGRSTLALQLGPGNADSDIAYFFGQNEAFLMQTSGTDVLFGSVKPQAAGPFTAASISETFLTATAAPTSEQAENDCGLTTFDGVGGITSTMDVNSDSVRDPHDWLHHFDFTGTYTVAANGRGTLTFSPPSNRSAVFWLISPTELVGIGAVDPSSPWSALLEYEK